MIWRSIRFEWPSAFLLLFIVAIAGWAFLALHQYREKKLRDFGDDAVLDVILEKRWSAAYWIKFGLICLAWMLAVLALMQPKGNEHYVNPSLKESQETTSTVRKKMHEVILLIDASASMVVGDGGGGETREQQAKQIADDVISHLNGENISLFAFTSATMQLVPSTTDYIFARLMLRQLEINEGETVGTDIKQALETIRKTFFDHPSIKPKTLILLTDGGDTHYESLSVEAKREALVAMLKPIEDAFEKNLRVLVVGVGSLEGKDVPGIIFEGHAVKSALEESLLRKISIAGQGHFFATNETTSQKIVETIGAAIAERSTYEEVSINHSMALGNEAIYDLYYQVPLAGAILALALFLVIPNTSKRRSTDKFYAKP